MEKDFSLVLVLLHVCSMPNLNWWLSVMTNWQWRWRFKWLHGGVPKMANEKTASICWYYVFSLDHMTKNAAETNSHLGNTMNFCRTNGLRIVTIRIIGVGGVASVVIVIIRSFTKGTIEYWSRCSLCTPAYDMKRQEKSVNGWHIDFKWVKEKEISKYFTYQKWYPLHARVVVGKKAWNAVVHWYRARYKRVR